MSEKKEASSELKLEPLIIRVFEGDEFKYDIELDDPREAFCNAINREYGRLGYEARPA